MIQKLEHEIREAYPEGLTWQKTVPTFHPETAEEAADIFRRAAQVGQKLFISGFSNNIDPVGNEFTDLLVVKTDRLNYIGPVEAADFCVTVGSGYPLKEINIGIADDNLWFPFSQTDYPGSAGGALASGLSGNDGSQVIPLSRQLLSLTAVLPDGTIVKPGAKTFKSVSGYDIARIFYNSWGRLGIVTELSFRVLPASKKDQSPHLSISPPNRGAFEDKLQGTSSLSELCRKIKDEFDPNQLLPAV